MNISKIISKIKLKKLVKHGLKIGINFKMEKGCMIDASFPWLIEIGDNVTLAPYVYILSHDGSTKPFLNYSKIASVKIGSNVFVGAKSTILPNVRIGNNVVIGSGSVVNKDIPDNTVVAGNPARIISTIDRFIEKNKSLMNNNLVYDESFTLRGGISRKKRKEMKDQIVGKIGFVD